MRHNIVLCFGGTGNRYAAANTDVIKPESHMSRYRSPPTGFDLRLLDRPPYHRHGCRLAAIALVLACCLSTKAAIAKSFEWYGSTSNQWTDGCNWYPKNSCPRDAKYPGQEEDDDEATIPQTPGATAHVQLTRALTLSKLSVGKGADIELQRLDVTDRVDWQGGLISGVLDIRSGATLDLSGKDEKWLVNRTNGTTIVNEGTMTVSGGRLWMSFEPRIVNKGRLQLSGAVEIIGNRCCNLSESEIENLGTIATAPEPVAPAPTTARIVNIRLLNKNRISLNERLRLANGLPEFSGGSVVEGWSDLEIAEGANLHLLGNVEIADSARVVLLAAGTLSGKAGWKGKGSFVWQGGFVDGQLHTAPETKVLILGQDEKRLMHSEPGIEGLIEIGGTTQWTGPGRMLFIVPSHLVNHGEMTIDGAVALVGSSCCQDPASIVSDKKLIWKAATGSGSIDNVILINKGEMTLGGQLSFLEGGAYDQQAGITMLADAVIRNPKPFVIEAGEMYGNGMIGGTLKNSGKLSPGGTAFAALFGKLSVQQLVEGDAAELVLHIGDAGNSDVLTVTGLATLSGKATLAWGASATTPTPFNPLQPATWRPLLATRRCGEFTEFASRIANVNYYLRGDYDSGASQGVIVQQAPLEGDANDSWEDTCRKKTACGQCPLRMKPTDSPNRELVNTHHGPQPPDSSAYVPDEKSLAERLAKMSAADRERLIRSYIATVKTLWEEANAPPRNLIATLDQAKNAKSGIAEIADLAGSRVGDFQFHIRIDELGGSNPSLARALIANDAGAATYARNAADSVMALVRLRHLEDTLLRILIAYDVAKEAQISLAEVLALYRAEGALAIPPARSSVDSIPPGTFDAPSSVFAQVDFSHLTWLANPLEFQGCSNVAATTKYAAVYEWFVQLAGLDNLGNRTVSDAENAYAAWAQENEQATGLGRGVLSPQERWDRLLATMLPSTVRSDKTCSTPALKVDVADSRLLVNTVLWDAVTYAVRLKDPRSILGALAAQDPLLTTRLSPALAYLNYHTQDDSDLRADWSDQPRVKLYSILESALWTVSKKNIRRVPGLLEAVRSDAGLRDLLNSPWATSNKTEIAAMTSQYWPAVQNWLRQGNHLELLGKFIESATMSEWGGWPEHRQNVSLYRQYLSYYQNLFGTAPPP